MSAAVSTSRTRCLDSAPRVTLGKPDKGSFAALTSLAVVGLCLQSWHPATHSSESRPLISRPPRWWMAPSRKSSFRTTEVKLPGGDPGGDRVI